VLASLAAEPDIHAVALFVSVAALRDKVDEHIADEEAQLLIAATGNGRNRPRHHCHRRRHPFDWHDRSSSSLVKYVLCRADP
jgi:hypothetical protein